MKAFIPICVAVGLLLIVEFLCLASNPQNFRGLSPRRQLVACVLIAAIFGLAGAVTMNILIWKGVVQ